MHNSIFNLPTKKEDLRSGNDGIADIYYDEVAPLRNIIDSGNAVNNFGNGLISFRWHPAPGTWWIPSRSYFRIDVELTKPDGTTPLELADDIAINMGTASCLFSKMQYRINNKTISEISEHVPQVDAMKQRLYRTGQWLKSTGDSANFWESSFEKRKHKVSSDGVVSDSVAFKHVAPDTAAGTDIPNPYFFDLSTPNQIEFTAANLIIFTANGGTAIPDLRNIFQIGDRVHFNDGAIKTRLITLVEPAQLTVGGAALTAVAVDDLAAQFKYIPRFYSPLASITANSRRAKSFSLIYIPPLSIFQVVHGIPGSSKHELDLTPFSNTVYQKNVIESALTDKAHTTDGAAGDFRLKITNMLFYACRTEGPKVEKGEFFLDLEELRCQISSITAPTRSQYSLDISPATHALSIAFQDEASETNSLFSQTKFKIQNAEELNLTNFYVRYGGLQKPQPDYRPLYDEAGNTDRMVEQWARSQLFNGAYYDSSSETLAEFYDRGLYMHWPWPKTANDRETRVYVSTQFSALTGTPRLLLFNHFKKFCILKYENGSLNSVLVNEA